MAKNAIARRKPPSTQVELLVNVDKETLAALRHVCQLAIKNKSALRDVLENMLKESLDDVRHEYRGGRPRAPRSQAGEPSEVHSRVVEGLNLSERAANAFREGMRRAGVTGVTYFADYTASEIQRFTNSSAKIAREIAEELERVGVRRRGTRP